MYIDRIFNGLYSNDDFDGIVRLFSEVRAFANSDYEKLTPLESQILREGRNRLADDIRKIRNKSEKGKVSLGYDRFNYDIKDDGEVAKDGKSLTDSELRDSLIKDANYLGKALTRDIRQEHNGSIVNRYKVDNPKKLFQSKDSYSKQLEDFIKNNKDIIEM